VPRGSFGEKNNAKKIEASRHLKWPGASNGTFFAVKNRLGGRKRAFLAAKAHEHERFEIGPFIFQRSPGQNGGLQRKQGMLIRVYSEDEHGISIPPHIRERAQSIATSTRARHRRSLSLGTIPAIEVAGNFISTLSWCDWHDDEAFDPLRFTVLIPLVDPHCSRVELEDGPRVDQPSGALVVFDMWHPHRLMTDDERARSSDSAEVWVSIGTDFAFEPTLDEIRSAFERIFQRFEMNPDLNAYDLDRIVFEGRSESLDEFGENRRNHLEAMPV
jgi:hypothetical protein